MKSTFLLLWIALLAGCTTSIERRDEFMSARLDKAASVYVALPPDGGAKGGPVAGSGQKTQAVLTRTLSAYMRNVTNGHQVETTEQAMATARARRQDYLFVPRILHWEDHRTEYSGRRDRVSVEIKVYDVAGGEPIGSTTIEGKSTFWSSGGEVPEDLLAPAVGVYVLKLLGYLPPDYE